MPREVREFSVTVPAGTPKAAPQVTSLAMPPRLVRRWTVRVPPGPRGEVGWALANGGTPIIPVTPTAWMVLDDQEVTWTLSGYVDSGTWAVRIYNTGSYSHTITLTAEVTLPATGAASSTSATTPLPVVGLTGSGGTPVTPGSTPVAVVPPPAPGTPVPVTVPTLPPPALPTLTPPPAVTVPTPTAAALPAPPTF